MSLFSAFALTSDSNFFALRAFFLNCKDWTKKIINYSLFTILYSFLLVGLSGLEPPTSRLSGGRSNRLSYKPIFTNSQFVMRNAQLLLRPAFVSHLSLREITTFWLTNIIIYSLFFIRYSFLLVEIIGIEPMTPCLQSRCSPSWAIPPFISLEDSVTPRCTPLFRK